ncbi:MAG: RDD family protein [Acidimicrobiales bacterium]|nr:RDD family protein [Actinomycetota bacterium]
MPPPRGPEAPRGQRIGARLIDAVVELILVVVALALVGDGDRPMAGLAVAWLVITLYEGLFVQVLGTTPGKAAVGLRVVSIDGVGNPEPKAAFKRAAVNAGLAVALLVGWVVWLVSSLTDTLGRGIADRAADTFVVHKRAPLPIASHDLPGYADGARPPRVTPLGRAGDLDVRMRARLRRIVDAPLLAAAVGLLALAPTLPVSTATFVLVTSVVWIVVFVADETIRIHRSGTTAGHQMAGLVVRSRRTGGPPSVGRSLARAVVLALTLYVPLLWPVLAASMAMVRWGDSARSLHDLAGGTVVVGDPTLDPEVQRQRAMQMRLGRAV